MLNLIHGQSPGSQVLKVYRHDTALEKGESNDHQMITKARPGQINRCHDRLSCTECERGASSSVKVYTDGPVGVVTVSYAQ